MYKLFRILCLISALFFFDDCFTRAADIAIRGSIIDEQGTPIPQVSGQIIKLGFSGQSYISHSVPATPTTFTSGVDGTFSLTSMPAGNYVLCVHPIGTHFIDSCEWNSALNLLVVSTSAPPQQKIVLRRGTLITVNLDDPLGKLTSGLPFDVFIGSATGKTGRGKVRPIDPAKRVFSVTVPTGDDYVFRFNTRLAVKDEAGSIISLGQRSTQFSTLGKTDVQAKFRVE